MFTATKDLMLPATVTGSWPRPRWYDQGLWGRPLDTALLDVASASNSSTRTLPSSPTRSAPASTS